MTAYDMPRGFDLSGFLGQPLIARIATQGPTIRPVWYLWEQEAFWWLTGDWSGLGQLIARDPAVALVIDTCDLREGEVLQLIASGRAEIRPFDAGRARRTLARYLGHDESKWDQERFVKGIFDDPSTAFVRLEPDRLTVKDLSYLRSV
jgi:nitroimidazol reductase NimA-like FMN-containing flavoprotein (pyridoxamine 5'-phosphate oxidase superfamily)